MPVNSLHSEISETIDVVIKTSLGSIEVELYSEKAPITVQNFLRYLDGGYYNRSSFYRTVRLNNDNGNPKIEVIQGGIGQVQKPFPMIIIKSYCSIE
jgi:peptidyl-prolyl cis-trans isomerase A (cyclophilin A)